MTTLVQAVTLLPLLAVSAERIWPAFVVAGVQGVLQQVNDPASFALVPRIVTTDQLVQANSANTAASSISRLVGSPLGGIAAALGGLTTVVVVDAATFVAVAVATAFVRTPSRRLRSRCSPCCSSPSSTMCSTATKPPSASSAGWPRSEASPPPCWSVASPPASSPRC